MNETPVCLVPPSDELWQLTESLLCGRLAGEDRERLESLLADDEARAFCAAYANLHAMLRWRYRPLPPSAAVVPPLASPHLGLIGGAVHGLVGLLSHDMTISYAVAAVVVGVWLAIASLVPVSHHTEFARQFGAPSPAAVERQFPPAERTTCVARVTGMVDVKWGKKGSGVRDWGLEEGSGFRVQGSGVENPEIPKSRNPEIPKSPVRLGDKFVLASGLLQLTYQSGAKVILQGPCTYEVDSPAGGFLSLGKLTAKVESGEWPVESAKTRAEGGPRRAASIHHSSFSIHHSSPPSSLPTTHYPLFTIKTPTAIVTDLGTEFGVVAEKDQGTEVHVFGGRVEVCRHVQDGETLKTIQLVAGEGISVGHGASQGRRLNADPNRFVTAMPRENRQPDLVARYRFDEIVDGMVLRTPDGSGHGRSAALLEMTRANLMPGKVGNALEFNVANGVSDQHILIPWSPIFDLAGKSFTIALWLNRRADCPAEADLLLHMDSSDAPRGGYSIMRSHQSRKLLLRMRDALNRATIIESGTPSGADDAPENTWVHFAAVGRFDPADSRYDVRLYLDGRSVGHKEHVDLANSRMPLAIGGVPDFGFVFRGLLDDVQIYHRALDAGEIKYLFDQPGELPSIKLREETPVPATDVGTKPSKDH